MYRTYIIKGSFRTKSTVYYDHVFATKASFIPWLRICFFQRTSKRHQFKKISIHFQSWPPEKKNSIGFELNFINRNFLDIFTEFAIKSLEKSRIFRYGLPLLWTIIISIIVFKITETYIIQSLLFGCEGRLAQPPLPLPLNTLLKIS